MDLDRIDRHILAELSNDARLTNKELAARIGLAPSTCLTRVRRLEAEGALGGYRAAVDLAACEIHLQAMIAVRLNQHRRTSYARLRKQFLARPEVLGLYHVAGDDDFLVHVGVRDAGHLRDLAWEVFTARTEVAQIRTSLIFEHALPDHPPGVLAEEGQGS